MDVWRGLVQLWLFLAVVFVLAIFAWDFDSISTVFHWSRFHPVGPGASYGTIMIKVLWVSLLAMALSFAVLAAGAGLFWAYRRFHGGKTGLPSH
jgi:hypothetical protein